MAVESVKKAMVKDGGGGGNGAHGKLWKDELLPSATIISKGSEQRVTFSVWEKKTVESLVNFSGNEPYFLVGKGNQFLFLQNKKEAYICISVAVVTTLTVLEEAAVGC